ncbi:MAG: Eco57I restriction-modification methylase domain-containing protein [Candidatus Thorarchaeota archaeon]
MNEETVLSARSIKKCTGSYYTPTYLAELISAETIFFWISRICRFHIRKPEDLDSLSVEKRLALIKKIQSIRILDPSVGEGVFLLASANLLDEVLLTLGDNRTESQRRRLIASENLYGVDLATHGVRTSRQKISDWANTNIDSNIRQGNSLIGSIVIPKDQDDLKLRNGLNTTRPFHWGKEFPEVFSDSQRGFDIILGNPPYGNILGKPERIHISKYYPSNIGGNRTGTWNSAAHFIVRTMALLNDDGQLGFLVPNSILRVKQFTKIRDFILNKARLWKIVDEGSPFVGVTLEMVSLFMEKVKSNGDHHIRVESRRNGLEQTNVVAHSVLSESGIFSIYHDNTFKEILEHGKKHQLSATRGRDIPRIHTRRNREPGYDIPYITSGRSVHRYNINDHHVTYTNDWFMRDSALTESFENEMLVATKNFRYPRCVLKPEGFVHGGGIVKISPQYKNADLRVLGLILNSRMVRHICVRYLTNYSQLTCCLNTGIMEELPLILPRRNQVYSTLFDSLSFRHSTNAGHTAEAEILERVSDALVYSLYLREDTNLEELIDESLSNQGEIAINRTILKEVDEILEANSVRKMESLCNYPPSEKSLRY